MPIVHDPATGQFTSTARGESAKKRRNVPSDLSSTQAEQFGNFMSHSTKVVKARYLGMLRGSSKVMSNPEPESKSRMSYKLAKAGHGIQAKIGGR